MGVHASTGYADADTSVQDDATMNAAAALLANRTDCDEFSPLNFDALLLGGYFCHPCLPDPCAADGGTCKNVWWKGHTCSNTQYVELGPGNRLTIGSVSAAIYSGGDSDGSSRVETESSFTKLTAGQVYKFVINSPGAPVFLVDRSTGTMYTNGVSGQGADGVEHGTIRLEVSENTPQLAFASPNLAISAGGVLAFEAGTGGGNGDGSDGGDGGDGDVGGDGGVGGAEDASSSVDLGVAVGVPVAVVLVGGLAAAVLIRRGDKRRVLLRTGDTPEVVVSPNPP